jgi:hypothetical protein
MSAVMMCDSCGNLFSVNQKGWRAFTEQWNGREDREVYNNDHNHGAMTRHIGPCCNLTGSEVKPRLALPPTEK